ALPLLRCPSDSWRPSTPASNYTGNSGAQSQDDRCGANADPFVPLYCGPKGGTPFGLQYTCGGDNGMFRQGSIGSSGLRTNIAAVTDGLSNTILIGETL